MARSIAKTIEPDEWIPRIDAAQRAGVHRNTIIEWERRRLLRVKRGPGPTGEQVLVSARDLGKIADKRPQRSSDRMTRLEAENRLLRERLEEVQAERDRLLHELLDIARGH
jgi:DNA-binding transcriptional MerR regulator